MVVLIVYFVYVNWLVILFVVVWGVGCKFVFIVIGDYKVLVVKEGFVSFLLLFFLVVIVIGVVIVIIGF